MPPPTCQFDPQQISLWSNRTGVRFLTDAQRDEAYLRSRPFLLEQMRILLEKGWKQSARNDSDEVLLDIHKPRTATGGRQPRGKKLNNLVLPNTFNSFLDTSKAETWRRIFENPAIFRAEKQKGNSINRGLHISSSRPLTNIFYLLQVLAPGMLVIHDEYQLPDADVKVSRVLPRASWIQSMLSMEVIGSMDGLLAAAQDQKMAFHEERTAKSRYNAPRGSERYTRPREPRYTITPGYFRSGNDYFSGEVGGYDWAVCDKDCGWCGRCQLNEY